MDRRTFIGTVGVAGAGLALGPRQLFAQAAGGAVPVYQLHSYTHRLDIERGFKLHCLVPRLGQEVYGAHEYAGFLTARVGDDPWMFIGDQPPEQGAIPKTLRDLRSGAFWLRRESPDHVTQIRQAVAWDALYPLVWFTTSLRLDREADVTVGLMGWGWAERKAPTAWTADGRPLRRPEGGELAFPGQCRVLSFEDDHGPFTGVLLFPASPQRVWADDDGVYWQWQHVPAGESVQIPTPAYALVPGRLTPPQRDALVELMPASPGPAPVGGILADPPGYRVANPLAQAVPVPPPLAALVTDRKRAVAIPAAAGDLLIVRGDECRTELPVPPELERPVPPKTAVPGEVVGEVSRHVEDVLAHRSPDGRFAFSEGRTFYDGFVCGALAQVVPLLEPPLREEAARAACACLDFLWQHQVRSKAYGLLVPPEQPSFIESAVDYPEITSCLLYGTLAYALNVDREYPRRYSDLIRIHFDQIGNMTSPCGTAYAAADTNRLHIIAESAIGGYLAWASMYHLGRMVDSPWTAESRARAALAWAGYRELFRWRPEFGEDNVVNGWWDWCAQVRTPEPWAYVQSTWFSFIPLVPYEHEDRYGLWRSLRAQPWWQYTAGPPPRQRAYDYANALALARAGYADEVKAHWREVHERPFSWETFDYTPVLAMAALPQLAALGALP